MRCFVTGGGGFIGSRVVRQLAAEGWEVAVLAQPGESLWRIDDIASGFEVIVAPLEQAEEIALFLRSWHPSACVHCAWYAEPGQYLESMKNINCVRDSLGLLENLAVAGCRNVVMLGSCAEYNSDAGFLKEEGPVGPATLYAACKLATCLIAEKFAARTGMTLAWARMFHLFGPDEDPRRMVPALIRTLLEGREFHASLGDQVRDYLHVDDAARGLLTLIDKCASGTFNICSGEPLTVRRLMQIIANETGRSEFIRFAAVPQRDWDPPFICGDSSKLRRLGWVPRYELHEAVRLTIEYWRSKHVGYRNQ